LKREDEKLGWRGTYERKREGDGGVSGRSASACGLESRKNLGRKAMRESRNTVAV